MEKLEHGILFHEIADSVVILKKGGVYKQATAYIRGNALYAKHGSGFVQLSPNGTSVTNLNVDAIYMPGVETTTGRTGRLEVTNLPALGLEDQTTVVPRLAATPAALGKSIDAKDETRG